MFHRDLFRELSHEIDDFDKCYNYVTYPQHISRVCEGRVNLLWESFIGTCLSMSGSGLGSRGLLSAVSGVDTMVYKYTYKLRAKRKYRGDIGNSPQPKMLAFLG